MSVIKVEGTVPELWIDNVKVNLKLFRQLPRATQFYRDEKILGFVVYPNKAREKFLVIDRGGVVLVPYSTRPSWVDYSAMLYKGGNPYVILKMSIEDHHRLFHAWIHVDTLDLPQIFI